jgi:predicted HicB family RNase H-like nuclease
MAWQDRERKSRQLAVLLKPSLYEKLAKMADKNRVSVNETINRLVEDAKFEEDGMK